MKYDNQLINIRESLMIPRGDEWGVVLVFEPQKVKIKI